ncbi:MAG: thiol reductant ABC exporter subunit CydC [Anaerolineaceae bacterium]|nr:thiol reductant ABC exporter subunit CydC [Anaerolineaceae bacterium]
MKSLFHLFRLMKFFLGWILLSLLMGIAAIGAGIGLLGTSSWLIASAALHPSIADLQVAIVGVRFFGISRGVFRYLERLISHSVNLHILSKLREDFYLRIEPGAPVNLRSYRSGDLLQRMMGDLETLENFYVRVVAPIIIAIVIAAGMSLFVGGYLIQCGIILAAGLVTNGFIFPILTIFISRPYTSDLTMANADVAALMVEGVQGLEDLQSFHAHHKWLETIQQGYSRSAKIQNKITAINATGNALSLLVLNLTVLGVVWSVIPKINTGEMNGIMLAVLALVTSATFEAVSTMPSAAINLNSSIDSAKRLFAFHRPEFEVKPPDRKILIPPGSELLFKKIRLIYPDTLQPVLMDVSFSLRTGEKKAIVGVSGAGKTSLLNLLFRFYSPSSGNILIDGINLQSIDQSDLHSIYGVVSQSPYLFSTSLRENLLLAKPAATDEELLQALDQAELGEWVHRLPDGLDTWLGERGMKMSAGERQRLAIARLILQDPPILLLDEPTANLDPVNETRILKNLFANFSKKSILLVTHRLTLLEHMDEILVLDHGEIIERGNYFDLMAREGRFKRMVDFADDLVSFENESLLDE